MIKDILIAEATYFPNPCPMWQEVELPPILRAFGKGIGKAWMFNGLRVIASAGMYDGVEWLHISYSRKDRVPSYNDTQLVLKHFLQNKKAVMVFPEEEHYVNIHPNCLHLWFSARNPLPDFDRNKSI